MSIQEKMINGSIIWYDSTKNTRWVGAVGETVRKYELTMGVPCDESTGDPTQWTHTAVEIGTGASTLANNTEKGYALLGTTAGNENDGINDQLKGSFITLEAGKPAYFGMKCKISEATQSDFLCGLCEVDTALIAAHALAVTDDGVYFSCLDGSTTINFTNELGGTEGTTAAAAAMTTGDHIYEIYYDGTNLHAYLDDSLVVTITSGIADQALTPSFVLQNGDDNARTIDIAWIRCYQIV